MNALKQTADAILQKPVTITIHTPAENWKERMLARLGLRKEERVFEVRPLVLGSLIRISELLLSIDKKLITQDKLEDKPEFLNLSFGLMQKHSRQMAEAVAVAVTNQKKEPPSSLVDFFLYNLTTNELLEVFMVVVQQMNVSGFINCIISIRGINVMEMNPENQGS